MSCDRGRPSTGTARRSTRIGGSAGRPCGR
jgi:hypothetical protein